MKFYDFSPVDFIDVRSEFDIIKVSKLAYGIMGEKNIFIRFYIKDLEHREANILKQEALSNGLELAISYKTYTMENKEKYTDAILSGDLYHLKKLLNKMELQPFRLKELAFKIKEYIEFQYNNESNPLIKIGNKDFYWKKNCYIMGILNATPDSFYANSRVDLSNILSKAKEMSDGGVDIFDVGGESTRPGSDPVPVEEELERVIPIIRLLKNNFDIPVSIDTTKAEVAEEAFKQGADILNDISACRFDPNMVKILKKYNKPICIMHIKGKPKDMQKNPSYINLIDEIYDYFEERINFLIDNGIDRNNIIIDPGIGFGKTKEHNYLLTKYLKAFKTFKLPILYGGSRKSFIGMTLKREPEKRLPASLSVHLQAYYNGSSFLRVHDVQEQKDAILMIHYINNQNRVLE